jgi:carboxyl-terminal processing protease
MEPMDTQIPITVLVDGGSASASEIVSGSLQDLDRAVVIGTESYGKGLVQQTKDLAYNTKIKLTVAKYYTPSGRCIQRLDYAHRDESTGEVAAKADSLIKSFKTKNGRPVKDGRGISPDVEVKEEDAAHILRSLMENWVVFHWATEYHRSHPTIDSANVFQLTDEEYNQFVAFAKGKDFHYDTHTEKLFEQLKKTAKEEKYFDGSEKQFEELFVKIEPKKENDLIKFKKQIKEFLEDEIVGRYYYQTGRSKNALRDDLCVLKSMEVLSSNYNQLLAPVDIKK